MVCEWGMSDLGPISFGGNNEVFLGRDFMKEREYSEETAAAVDHTVHAILAEAYSDAKDIVIKQRVLLDAIADELMERETLGAEDLDEIIRANGGADLLPPKKTPPKREPTPVRRVEETPKEPVASEEPDTGNAPPGDILPGTA